MRSTQELNTIFRDLNDGMPERHVSFEQIVTTSRVVRWWKKRKSAIRRWKRAGRKIQALNSISTSVDSVELRQRIGDAIIVTEDEAHNLQRAIERTTRQKLDFQIKSGDIVLGAFKDLPEVGKPKLDGHNGQITLGRKRHHSIGHQLVSDQLKSFTRKCFR